MKRLAQPYRSCKCFIRTPLFQVQHPVDSSSELTFSKSISVLLINLKIQTENLLPFAPLHHCIVIEILSFSIFFSFCVCALHFVGAVSSQSGFLCFIL